MSGLSIVSLLINLLFGKETNENKKTKLFFVLCFTFFIISLIPLKLGAGSNRTLVLLPFMIVFLGYFLKQIILSSTPYKRTIILFIFLTGLTMQSWQTFSWLSVRLATDPREIASKWILKNVAKGSNIGLENIPIYQKIPDFVLKDFYEKDYRKSYDNYYTYDIIDVNTINLPNYVILTSSHDNQYILNPSATHILKILQKQKYKKIASFSPNLTYYSKMNDEVTFMTSGLIAVPLSIDIYKNY
jgi:hypothetical protein